MRSPLRAACAALAIVVLLAGCSSGSRPVAKVGDRTLRVDDFVSLARGNESNFPGPPEEAKAMLLQELVRRELVEQAARTHGLDTVGTARAFERKTREEVVLAALYQQLAPRDIGVSDAETRFLYEARSQAAELHLVYNPLRPIIDVAMQRLAAGMPFDEVARQHNSPGSLPPGGAIGMVSYGDLFPPLDEIVRSLPVGQIGGPYETPKGWFIARVARREPTKQQDYELQKPMLEQMLRQRKSAQAVVNAQVALEAAYHVRIVDEGVADIFRIVAPSRSAIAEHWLPNETERRRPVVVFDGGVYTLGDAVDDLMSSSERGPDPNAITAVRAWAEERALGRIALREAERRHVGEEPAVAREIRMKVAMHMMEGEATSVAQHAPPPTEAEARDMWDSVKQMYPVVRSARVQWIATRDTAVLGTLTRSTARGEPLRDAVQAIDPGVVVREELIRFPQPDPFWNELQPALAQMPLGERTGPHPAGDGLRVVQLVTRDAAPLDWEQLPQQAKENVTRNVGQRGQQQVIGAYLDSLWKAAQPVLMPENLRKLPWPLPAPAPGGS